MVSIMIMVIIMVSAFGDFALDFAPDLYRGKCRLVWAMDIFLNEYKAYYFEYYPRRQLISRILNRVVNFQIPVSGLLLASAGCGP